MRIFRAKKSLNWKYIFGEILLIFLGINLAIWFNNWNTNQYNAKAKKVAIQKIKEEINNNLIELNTSYDNARLIKGALGDLIPLYYQNTSTVLATPEQMAIFQQDFKGFFRISDSLAQEDNKFIYRGGTAIEFELIELSDIAWETTKSIEVLNEFGYECLYDLESLYNLQERVQKEINKGGDALQSNRNMNPLLGVVNFLVQLEAQLKQDYLDILEKIDDCE